MTPLFLKICAIVAIFAGETFSIYAEVIAAKHHATGNMAILPIFFKAFALITIWGALLVAGYMLGIHALKNIWIIGVASIASIIVMEPAITWLIFHEPPTTGALIGLILWMIGLIAATFF